MRRITRGGMGEVSPALFQKLGKISLTLGKNTLITVIRVLNFSFKVQFKRVSGKKTWRFLSSVVDDCLSKCPHPKKNFLSWNISGYAPVITLPFDFGERNFSSTIKRSQNIIVAFITVCFCAKLIEVKSLQKQSFAGVFQNIIDALKNLVILTGKHLRWSLSSIELQAWKHASLLKRAGAFPWKLRNF